MTLCHIMKLNKYGAEVRDMSDNLARLPEEENETFQTEKKDKSPHSAVWKALRGLFAAFWKGLCGLCELIHVSPRIAAIVVVLLLVAGGSSAITGMMVRTNTSSRTTQFGLRNIGELATQSGYYTNVQVIDKWQELWGMQVPFTQSKYVFSYDGVIRAGLDFSAIDVQVDEAAGEIRVTLPEIQILSNEIDPNSLEIYDERNNIFTPLNLDAMNNSLLDLREESQQTAVGNGLLEQAAENAKLLITGFLSGMYDLQRYSIVYV